MTYSILGFALLSGLLLVALVYERGQFAKERETWREERGSLLTRIQHPQLIQPTSIMGVEPGPPPEPDEWALVGTIVDNDPPEDPTSSGPFG